MYNPCNDPECTMPCWRDGIDDAKCVGHQPLLIPATMEHPTKPGEVLTIEDPATDPEMCLCWECGLKPPASLALYDQYMPGEILCEPCATKVKAHIRIDTGGDNY